MCTFEVVSLQMEQRVFVDSESELVGLCGADGLQYLLDSEVGTSVWTLLSELYRNGVQRFVFLSDRIDV